MVHSRAVGKAVNNGDTRRFDVRLTPELDDFLDGLAKLGLYGGSKAEVVRYLVKLGVERVLRDRAIDNFVKDRATLRALEKE